MRLFSPYDSVHKFTQYSFCSGGSRIFKGGDGGRGP